MPVTDPETSLPPKNAPASLAELFWSFTSIALQGFGGVLAIAQREMVEKRRWFTREEFLEDWAVAQVLPGPNIVNLSLMFGDRHFGLRGAVVAVTGMLAFPLLALLAMALLFSSISDVPAAQGALRGMGAAAAGLVIAAGLKLVGALKRSVMGPLACGLIGVSTFVSIALLRTPLAWVLLVLGGTASVWAWYRLGRP